MKDVVKFLQPLYPKRPIDDLERTLNLMKVDGWQVLSSPDTVIIYRICRRMHIGDVLIIDTIMTTKKGNGTTYINKLKKMFPKIPIQLDCAVENKKAQKFYHKAGLSIRAYSFVESK